MSETLSIDTTQFNSVVSEARQLSRQLERQARTYENIKNSLNSVDESNRNNLSQAVSDLERKVQDLQSKRDSVDAFIRTVTEFNSDVDNTEREVASLFPNSTFPRLNSIEPTQVAMYLAGKSVATMFTAILEMGPSPGF